MIEQFEREKLRKNDKKSEAENLDNFLNPLKPELQDK